MNKRVLCLVLCIAMLISIVPISAAADELTFYQVMIDAGNGTQREKAIIEDGEIYIAASSFEKYTRYEYHEDMPGFLGKGQEEDKAFKKVLVNAQTKKAAVGTKLIELSNSFVVDGEAYLPLCQMLPMLNASIIDVDHSVIYIVNNELSMAELLYDFTLEDYAFNIVDEFFGDEDSAKNYIGWAYLLDTVKDFRLDRLDVVFKSGESKDYQEIFTEYIKDDELFHKAMNSDENFAGYLLETIVDINSETESFYTIYEWFEKVGKSDSANKVVQFIKTTSDSSVFDEDWYQIINVTHEDAFKLKIKDKNVASFSLADFYEAAGYVYSYLNHVADHPEMLDAVYGLTIPGKSASMFSINPEVTAANKVYHAYIDDFYPAMRKKLAETIVVKSAEEALENTTLGFYKLTFGLAGEVIDGIWPGDAGERAVLMYHSNIVNTATGRACVPTLNTQDETNDYRLSLLLTLIASRTCYQIMAENKNGYQQYHDRYEEKIEKIENMIMGLYLVAGNVAFDTYENYEAFAEQNRQILKDAGMFEDIMPYPEVDESDYLAFLNDHPEYNYYSLLDINGDGVLELLAAYEVNDDFNPVGDVDIFIYRDGEICLGLSDVWAKYDALLFDKDNHWVAQHHGGSSGYGMTFYYIDQLLCFQEMSFDTRCERVDEYGNEVWDKYYNWEKITSDNTQDYDNLVEAWTNSNPENIVFQALPKAALIGEWNLYPSAIPHENGYWFDVVSSELYLGADGNVSVARGIVQGEYIDGYSGTWTAVPEGDNKFTLQLKLKGGMLYYSDEGTDEQKKCELLLRVKLDGDRLWLEKISGDDICLYYSEEYERDLEYETWVVRQGPVEDHITYKTLLWQYPEHAEYTLHDIDKDDQDELIIREMSSYYVYTMIGGKVKSCGEIYSHYSPYCLYGYDGNGVIVHDGGIGSLHYEYVALHSLSDGLLTEGQNLIDTEWHTLDELHSYLSQYTLIDNFISVVDETLLEEQ